MECRLGSEMTVQIMTNHSEARTTEASKTEWKAFCEHCNECDGGDREFTGTDLVCFVGWLAEPKICKNRKVSSRSLPQYLSEILTIYSKLSLPLPQSPGYYPPLKSFF